MLSYGLARVISGPGKRRAVRPCQNNCERDLAFPTNQLHAQGLGDSAVDSSGELSTVSGVMKTTCKPAAMSSFSVRFEPYKENGSPDQHPRPMRAGGAARRAPPPASGKSDQGGLAAARPRARDAQGGPPGPSPRGDERECANLEQPDSGAAAGAPRCSPCSLETLCLGFPLPWFRTP